MSQDLLNRKNLESEFERQSKEQGMDVIGMGKEDYKDYFIDWLVDNLKTSRDFTEHQVNVIAQMAGLSNQQNIELSKDILEKMKEIDFLELITEGLIISNDKLQQKVQNLKGKIRL